MDAKAWKNVGIVVLLIHIFLCIFTAFNILGLNLADYELVYVSNIGSDFVVLLTCICIFFSTLMDQRMNRSTGLFMALLSQEALLLTLDIFNWIINGNQDLITLNLAVNFLIYSMMYSMLLTYWLYLMDLFKEKRTRGKWRNTLVFSCVAAGMVLIVVNVFTGIYFYVDDTGWYHRGDLFMISMICPSIISVVALETVLHYEKNLGRRLTLMFYIIIPYAASILQSFIYGISLQYISMMIALIIMYANIYVYRGVELVVKESEMMEQRMEVMVSQIQPHFLYNVLTSIMNIKGCSEESRDAIVDFSRYLRFNLDSTKTSNPIPVSAEINHIETYISIRKLHYGEKLNLETQIRDINIHVPAQSLKTIVKTIVDANLDLSERLNVRIETNQNETGHQIIISYDNTLSEEEVDSILGSETMKPAIKRMEKNLKCTFTYRIEPRDMITIYLTMPKTKGGKA